jgi:hypothetical protein
VTLTIVPPPRARMERAAASAIAAGRPMFNRVTACQPFAVIASAALKYCPPALLTSTSRPAAALAGGGHEAVGVGIVAYVPHDVRAGRSDLRRGAGEHVLAAPAITTSAPHAASSRAVARPSPVPPPVTSAVRPASAYGAKTAELTPPSP